MNDTTTPTVLNLATSFSAVLASWLTPEQRDQVVRRNLDEINPHICHSHDFCDANQAMLDAMALLSMEFDAQNEEQGNLIHAAWEMAKCNAFWFKPSRSIVVKMTAEIDGRSYPLNDWDWSQSVQDAIHDGALAAENVNDAGIVDFIKEEMKWNQ